MIRTSTVIPLVVQTKHIDAFVQLYKQIFSAEPYGEEYTDEWILENVWAYHLRHGTIVIAEDEKSQVIGFACAVRLANAPADVQEFLKNAWMQEQLPEELSPSMTWYMSELGVDPSKNREEVAYELIRNRLISASHAGMVHYVTRTDPTTSVSRALYESIGAQRIASEQDMTGTTQGKLLHTRSKKRVYLYGHAREALDKVILAGRGKNQGAS